VAAALFLCLSRTTSACTSSAHPPPRHSPAPPQSRIQLTDHTTDCVSPTTPRLLINRERVGEQSSYQIIPGIGGGDGFDFDAGYRDALFLGDCDDGVRQLAELLGWESDLERLIEEAGCAAAGSGAARAAAAGAGLARGMKEDEEKEGVVENGRSIASQEVGEEADDGSVL